MRSRVADAVAMFESGYNCAQSVFVTYADLFGMDRETALKISCPMGGGMGRMREMCGAISSMSMLGGLKTGNTDPENQEAKTANYELTRRMADRFKAENGSMICRELLGLSGREESAAPSLRTAEYYASRPCSRLVASAARIIEETLLVE
ncbi:MAG: C_GCAxxG_C_C family protein [Lachnospiraceae bacterium]|nr:C_GCAxxG_C_C family protein [Lachnospiraceae bacterium]